MQQPHIIDHNEVMEQQEHQQEEDIHQDIENQEEQLLADIEEHSLRMIQQQQQQIQPQEKQQKLQVVKNPVSPYMVFVSGWKKKHPDQKMELSFMGKIWNELDMDQKKFYLEQFKIKKAQYQKYIQQAQINDPNAGKKNNISLFPLHRVRCIMKQDPNFAANTETVYSMAKATQFFGQYLLEEVKKTTQGKNRITHEDLFQTISIKSKVIGFLQCLIDEYVFDTESVMETHKEKQQTKPKTERPRKPLELQQDNIRKQKKAEKTTPHKVTLPPNQKTLNDMFFKKN